VDEDGINFDWVVRLGPYEARLLDEGEVDEVWPCREGANCIRGLDMDLVLLATRHMLERDREPCLDGEGGDELREAGHDQ
jgi:hypothetical protein